MARFNKVTPELLEELRRVLGEKGLTVDEENYRPIRLMRKVIHIGSTCQK